MAKEPESLFDEIRSLKMLMILQLLRQGVRQGQIAAALGISEATMSRMLPKGIAKNMKSSSAVPAGELE